MSYDLKIIDPKITKDTIEEFLYGYYMDYHLIKKTIRYSFWYKPLFLIDLNIIEFYIEIDRTVLRDLYIKILDVIPITVRYDHIWCRHEADKLIEQGYKLDRFYLRRYDDDSYYIVYCFDTKDDALIRKLSNGI